MNKNASPKDNNIAQTYQHLKDLVSDNDDAKVEELILLEQ